jgi:hypothetical protein
MRIGRAVSANKATEQPEDILPTRAFSGRLGRSIATAYVKAANAPEWYCRISLSTFHGGALDRRPIHTTVYN